MRVIVLFDLPTETSEERKRYRQFRKLLITHGFFMMQESVYCKLVLNASASRAISKVIRENKPASGLVQLMVITEKQYQNIEWIVGESSHDVLDNDERLIIL